MSGVDRVRINQIKPIYTHLRRHPRGGHKGGEEAAGEVDDLEGGGVVAQQQIPGSHRGADAARGGLGAGGAGNVCVCVWKGIEGVGLKG